MSYADILSSAEASNGRLTSGLSRSNMEINTASSRGADLTAGLRSSGDKGWYYVHVCLGVHFGLIDLRRSIVL